MQLPCEFSFSQMTFPVYFCVTLFEINLINFNLVFFLLGGKIHCMGTVRGHKYDKDRWFTIERVYCISQVSGWSGCFYLSVWQTGVCCIYIVA